MSLLPLHPLVLAVTSADRATLEDAATDAARAGRVFAIHLLAFADTFGVKGPVLSTALAIVVASLLVDLDGQPGCDAARLAVFIEQVRAAAGEMRAARDPIG